MLRLLERGDLTLEGRIVAASNASFLGTVREGEASATCVYKPVRGERPLEDFPDGTLWKRERAAFLVSEASGWDIVPPTVVRADGPFGEGMAQLWIDVDERVDVWRGGHAADQRLRRVLLFRAPGPKAGPQGGPLPPPPRRPPYRAEHRTLFPPAPHPATVPSGL